MKNLFKTVLFAAVGAVLFASCNDKNDFDYEAEYLKQEKHLDSLLSAEKLQIEDYVDAQFGDLAQEDTLEIKFSYLGKSVKRGFWYEVLAEPTEIDDNAYEYKFNDAGYVILPKVKMKYTAKLLNGTVVEEDPTGTEYNLNQNFPEKREAWLYSFVPYSIKYNAQNNVIKGFTKKGLKKGSKFRVVTPSIYAYGSVSKDKIPANSPLVYEFEVLEINN